MNSDNMVGLATGGGDTSGGSREAPPQEPPTLADAGIDKKLSSRAQKLAAVPEEQFEGMVRTNTQKRVGKFAHPRYPKTAPPE
jgi:hypothetical protein